LYYYQKSIVHPIAFCISNSSIIGATDIKVEITITADKSNVEFLLSDELQTRPLARYNRLDIISQSNNIHVKQTKPDIVVNQINNVWHLDVLFDKVQAGQTVFSKDMIYFSSKKNGKITLNYNIFADNLPSPIQDSLTLDVTVDKWESDLDEIKLLNRQEYLKKSK
jgi:hypothetical protein